MKSRLSSESGFTLPEVLVVTALIAILSGIAVSLVGSWLPIARADAGMRQVMLQFTRAREQAISERREIEIQFVGNNTLVLLRRDLDPAVPAEVLRQVSLEYDVRFTQLPGVPDTPDTFGAGSALDFQGAGEIMFTSDGSLIDETGIPVNGTVFLGLPPHVQSARGVTVFGGTGRIRGFRWNGVQWSQ